MLKQKVLLSSPVSPICKIYNSTKKQTSKYKYTYSFFLSFSNSFILGAYETVSKARNAQSTVMVSNGDIRGRLTHQWEFRKKKKKKNIVK